MQTTLDDFQKRKEEVEAYFAFIALLSNQNPSLHYTEFNEGVLNQRLYKIDDNLAKILKANGFLILYNMIEATVRNALLSILNAAESDELHLNQLSDELKKLWIIYKVKINRESSADTWASLIENIIVNNIHNKIEFDARTVDLSGNVDAKKIRELGNIYGFETPRESDSRNNNTEKIQHILTTKTNRNYLAHGEKTFAECGQIYTIDDILKIKKSTIEYLNEVVNNIAQFINNKKYKLQLN